MARKRVIEAPSLKSWEDVNDALQQIAEATIALGDIESEMQKQVVGAQKAAEQQSKPYKDRIATLEREVKIDLHHLRAVQAQRAYRCYDRRLREEPTYRVQLEQEIKLRWQLYNKRRWKQRDFEGVYKLRGANKELARRLGRPTEYDRLAVLATSVYHLSHWRCDVTISNYLLAY